MRSTRNLRAREGSGASRRGPGMGETPGPVWAPGPVRVWRCPSRTGAPTGPEESTGPWEVVQAGARPAARPVTAPPGWPEGAGCPNLPQRPRSSRNAGRESLIFRASVRRRSRPRASLWQIWTRRHPDPPQESHPLHADTPRITFRLQHDVRADHSSDPRKGCIEVSPHQQRHEDHGYDALEVERASSSE